MIWYATKEPAEIIIRPRELSFELTQQQRDILASKKAKLDIRGALIGQVINTYNADGEMQQIQQFGRTEENLFQNATLEFNASHPLDYYLSLDVGEIINVAHFYSNPAELRRVSQTIYSGLNEGGMATATQITEFGEKSGDADITRNFTRSYQLRDNWLETKVEGSGYATTGKVSPGSTSSIYDSNGNRKEINEINDNTPDETITRRMLFAADGTLVKKMEGKKGKLTLTDFLTGNGGFTQEAYSYHFTSNGNYLGEVAEGKKSTNLSQQFGKITSTLKNQHFSAPDLTSGTPASNYQVRSGDTLKNIALMFYGNSDYWYLIANTNGLTSDPTAPLVAGMALDIPARATQENTSTSFKPMQLEQIIGDSNPYLPYIPPPPKCNAIAMIVMIAVTVMVSVATSGALSSTAVGAFGGGFGAGFIGGVAGSVAGQSVGKALGVVEHFSLKQALASGITQGFATGAAETLKASQWAKDAGLVVEAGKHAGELEAAGKMLLAATSVGVNWAANRLVGNNSVSFSWRNVVTSAAAAGAMHGIESIGVGNADDTVGTMLKSFSDSNPVTGGTVQNIMSAAVSWNVKRGIYGNHFKDEHWNFKEVARDAFGNALGSAIAGHFIKKDAELTNNVLNAGMDPKNSDDRALMEEYLKAKSNPHASAKDMELLGMQMDVARSMNRINGSASNATSFGSGSEFTSILGNQLADGESVVNGRILPIDDFQYEMYSELLNLKFERLNPKGVKLNMVNGYALINDKGDKHFTDSAVDAEIKRMTGYNLLNAEESTVTDFVNGSMVEQRVINLYRSAFETDIRGINIGDNRMTAFELSAGLDTAYFALTHEMGHATLDMNGLNESQREAKANIYAAQMVMIDKGLLQSGNAIGIWGPKTKAAYHKFSKQFSEQSSSIGYKTLMDVSATSKKIGKNIVERAQVRSLKGDDGEIRALNKSITGQELEIVRFLNESIKYKDSNKTNALELQHLFGFVGASADGDFASTSWMAKEIFDNSPTESTLSSIRAAKGSKAEIKKLFTSVQNAKVNYQEVNIDKLIAANNQSGLPDHIVKAVFAIESGDQFNAGARNPESSATGIGQVLEIALRDYNIAYGTTYGMEDLYDPAINIKVATGHMARIKQVYKVSSAEEILKHYSGNKDPKENEKYWAKVQAHKYYKGNK